MSPLSNPERPYQSRILSFINRQRLRLGDRAGIGLRQLKTVTTWGLQLIAYPLYLLLQTSTRLGKRLQTKVSALLDSPEEKKAIASVGSQPTAVILDSLHPWLENSSYQMLSLRQTRESIRQKLPTETPSTDASLVTPETSQTESYFIQGIASYLETGKLVLVTTENQAIDFLSDIQHEQLKHRIKVLLECYEDIQKPWWWRIAQERKRGRSHPLRWLAEFMIWAQTSSIAKGLNWFQESKLDFSSGYEQISQIPPFQQKSEGIAKLDHTLSRLEDTRLAPVVKKLKTWFDHVERSNNNHPVFSLIRSAVDYFYGVNPEKSLTQSSPSLLQPVSNLVQRAKEIIKPPASEIETDPDSIQRLIAAAYEYFLGKSEERLPYLAEEIAATDEDEPWLMKTDLFEGNQFPKQLAATTVASYFSTESEPESTSDAEYFATEATSMGYEKHILARILEWLDRAIAWLENRLLQIWQWLKQFLSLKRD